MSTVIVAVAASNYARARTLQSITIQPLTLCNLTFEVPFKSKDLATTTLETFLKLL